MPDEPAAPIVQPALPGMAASERAAKAGAGSLTEATGGDTAAAGARRGLQLLVVPYRVVLVALALWCFIIALQLIKSGALGLKPILNSVSGGGILGHLGFGWLG